MAKSSHGGVPVLFAAPAVEPLARDTTVKSHLRIATAFTAHDTLLDALIVAARTAVENFLGRRLITSTWDTYWDAFPKIFRVPYPPIQSVTSIKYIDTDAAEQTLSSSRYRLDSATEPGRIEVALNDAWPATNPVVNAVIVRHVSGYGDAATDVPGPIKQAMLMDIADMYEHPETRTEQRLADNDTYKRLLSPFVVYWQ